MKTAPFVLAFAALAGCGPAPVSVNKSNNEIGRYQIYYAKDPADPRQPLVLKLDTALGDTYQLNVAPAYEHGPDGYADMTKPVWNKHGSFYGALYWKYVPTTREAADNENATKYRPATNE